MLRHFHSAFAWFCLVAFSGIATPAYVHADANVLQADPQDVAALKKAEADSLLPRIAPGTPPSADIWKPTDWSLDAWRGIKTEEALAGEIDGTWLATGTIDADTLSIKVSTQNFKRETFTRRVALGLTLHSLLLKKELLQRLGYAFPAMAYLPKFKLHFGSTQEKEDFKNKLEQQSQAAANRWIIEETDVTLLLQDVAISIDTDINPAFNSPELLAPYVLGDMAEDVNLYSWIAGTPEAQGFRVNTPMADRLHPTEADMVKIIGRLGQLKRTDFEHVVRQARFPHAVQALVVEKLIARSESLLAYYAPNRDGLSIDEKISVGMELQDGVLRGQDWPGYASRFSTVTPSTAATAGGLKNFTNTQAFSILLALAVKKFNDLPFMHTDIVKAYDDQTAKELADQLQNYQQTGQLGKVPLGTWGFGFAYGQLILNREVVTGSFLGTNNVLQVTDQIGVRIDAGGQLNLQGGPTPLSANLRGDLAVSRTYTLVRPVNNFAEANSETFKSSPLPYMIKGKAKGISIELLKKYLKPGQSLIITDSLVGNAALKAAALAYQYFEVSANGAASEFILNRVHIYRKDEDTIQVHTDFAEAHDLALTLSLGIRVKIPHWARFLVSKPDAQDKATFPLYTYTWNKNNGAVTTQFFPVPLNNVSAEWVKPAMAGNLEVLQAHVKPYVIRNKFRERNNENRFLWFTGRHLKSNMDLSVESPEGQKRNFIRDYFAKVWGRNYQKASNDILGLIFRIPTAGNMSMFTGVEPASPGYTLFGKGKSTVVQYEGEVDGQNNVQSSFVKLTKAYNGWRITPRKLQRLLRKISGDAGFQVNATKEMAAAPEVMLYNISVNTEISNAALENIENLNRNDIYRASARRAAFSEDEIVEDEEGNQSADDIYDAFAKFRKERSSKQLMKALTMANDYLDPDEFIRMMGGEQNVHIYTKAEGILPTPASDTPIRTMDIQEIKGRAIKAGPLSATQNKLGMTDGEFYSQWITGRIF